MNEPNLAKAEDLKEMKMRIEIEKITGKVEGKGYK